MRTRFLATVYSTTAPAVAGPFETPDFVPLPLPDFSPSICTQFHANFALSFDEIPVLGASSEIEKLPIDDALSVFLSDVLPRFVDGLGSEEHRIKSSEENSKLIRSEEKDGTTSNNKGKDPLNFVQFEIPEMDIPSLMSEKSVVHSQIECPLLSSEISDAEPIEFEMQEWLKSELMLHNSSEIQQSVYSVDEMSVEYPVSANSDLLEDADHVQGEVHYHKIKFPLFEVDVESLCILGRIYMMDELLTFENIEKQQAAHSVEVISNKELLGSMDFDLIEYLLKGCVAIHCLEESFPSQLDYTSMIDLSCCQEYSTVHGKPGGDLIWSKDPVLFDEFFFFALDAYYFSEVFSESAQEIDAEICDSMFGETMNFRSFSELIVCQELTLMDDYFKSLPVPILSDHGTNSSHALVEKLLAQLDWQSSSASDGLYLDWNFLGENDCGSGKYSCWKMVCEIDTYNIDADMGPNDIGKQIFDFLLSDCHSKIPNADNYKEILNLTHSDGSMLHTTGKAGPSSSGNHREGKTINGDALLRTGVEKVPRFCESMSSDLDFFLNPRNYVTGRETTDVDKSTGTNTVCHSVMSTDDSAVVNIKTTVEQKWNGEMYQKRDMDSTSAEKECETKLEELFNTIPETVQDVNEHEGCNMMPVQSMSVGLESKQKLSCKPLCPKTIIIVNTRNFNEEMIISRRSTYQRILEMEQEGAQVVERDIDLPVDMILSTSVCLTWYDHRYIGRKASAPDEAFSCLPLCVTSIAASTLTSLSYAFSCCILIFEGDFNFLYSIMESSDELYAAAASLGINIRLFCSYSFQSTEEIILSCINVAAEFSRALYPRMSDSESLAESFLNAFPSINPLSAHAILSSDVILGKFMELSNEDRICALKKYKVPDESVALLSAISRYGEQEDSKSVLTNSSSSVSVPDSDNVVFRIAPERKKRKYTHNHYDSSEPPNDLFQTESLKLLPDDQLDLPKLSASCNNSWLAENTEIYNKSEQINLSFNDNLFGHCPDIDVNLKKSINKSSLQDFPLTKGLQISDEREKPWMPQIDIDCSPRWKSDTASKKSFSTQSAKVTGTLPENLTGEVVDVDDTSGFMGNFSVGDFSRSLPFELDVEKDFASRISRIKRPYCATNLPPFSNTTDNTSDPGATVSRDKAQILRKDKPHFDTIKKNSISMTNQKGIEGENMIEKDPQTSYEMLFQNKGTRSFGGMPLSNALHCTQPQGSPWTIEFFNRTRENSRLRKQSVSYDLSHPCFDSPGNTSKFTKRKSPSIIEFYKYEGRSTPQEKVEQKRPKRSSQPLKSSKKKNASASCSPSWTPDDKIARRALSFSSNGSGGQSKLVWRDNNYRNTQRRLQYQAK